MEAHPGLRTLPVVIAKHDIYRVQVDRLRDRLCATLVALEYAKADVEPFGQLFVASNFIGRSLQDDRGGPVWNQPAPFCAQGILLRSELWRQ
jgi:hypothetical protein